MYFLTTSACLLHSKTFSFHECSCLTYLFCCFTCNCLETLNATILILLVFVCVRCRLAMCVARWRHDGCQGRVWWQWLLRRSVLSWRRRWWWCHQETTWCRVAVTTCWCSRRTMKGVMLTTVTASLQVRPLYGSGPRNLEWEAANANCPPDYVMFQYFAHQIACITMQ